MSTAKADKNRGITPDDLAWLFSTPSEIILPIRSELLKTILEPVAVACTLHAFTFSAAFLTYFATKSTWPLMWITIEAIVASSRIFLLWRLRTVSIESRTFSWLHRITALWFFFLGLAALGCVRSENVATIILTSNLIIALQGGIASRLASAPRFATLLSIALIAPTVFGMWGLTQAWIYAIPATYVMCFFGMHQLTQQNHKILCDKISAEHQNLALLMRDPLTGIANRRELRNKIEVLNSSPLKSYALLYLDLDGFKAVNDQHGHVVGDQLLIGVSQRLISNTRSDDLACRLGGDEFVVVLVDIDEEGAKRRAAELIACLSEPFELANEVTARIGASIGIALGNSSSTSMESIVKRADEALYQAKRAGKGTYRLSYNSSSDSLQPAGHDPSRQGAPAQSTLFQ